MQLLCISKHNLIQDPCRLQYELQRIRCRPPSGTEWEEERTGMALLLNQQAAAISQVCLGRTSHQQNTPASNVMGAQGVKKKEIFLQVTSKQKSLMPQLICSRLTHCSGKAILSTSKKVKTKNKVNRHLGKSGKSISQAVRFLTKAAHSKAKGQFPIKR